MDLSQLAVRCHRYSIGDHALGPEGLPGLLVLRREAVSQIEATVYDPVLCLILQGSKITAVSEHSVTLHPGEALLVSHDLPVVSRITEASMRRPYLALILSLDLALIRGLYQELADTSFPEPPRAGPLVTARAEPDWVDPLSRYAALMDSPRDARVLGSALRREVHYRLLCSEIGGALRRLLVADSHASRIARAIARLRTGFRGPIGVAELAGIAGMSASSFHEHFKQVTGTTPLQYLKDLRLIEARGLLTVGGQSVAQAAFAVGYESPTHFSRDYSRKFGQPPSREARL